MCSELTCLEIEKYIIEIMWISCEIVWNAVGLYNVFECNFYDVFYMYMLFDLSWSSDILSSVQEMTMD